MEFFYLIKMFQSFFDSELTIPRSEIVEITDYKIIVRDEEKVIKERALKEDFVPNFVNPFRKTEQPTPAPSHIETPAEEEPEEETPAEEATEEEKKEDKEE